MIRHAKALAVLACGVFAPAVWAADALTGEVQKQPLNVSAIAMFVAGCFGYIYQVGLPPFFNNLNGLAYARFASYDLSVIPLFILMGNFVARAGLAPSCRARCTP